MSLDMSLAWRSGYSRSTRQNIAYHTLGALGMARITPNGLSGAIQFVSHSTWLALVERGDGLLDAPLARLRRLRALDLLHVVVLHAVG